MRMSTKSATNQIAPIRVTRIRMRMSTKSVTNLTAQIQAMRILTIMGMRMLGLELLFIERGVPSILVA
jgi:hypothetical protein